MNKKKVAIMFGGKCAEHTISIMSAREVDAIVDRNKYDVYYLGIDQSGKIREVDEIGDDEVLEFSDDEPLLPAQELELLNDMDVVLPILHGTYGEDGRIQGLLETIGVNYIGERILSSALCMDKDLLKKVLAYEGVLVADWDTLYKGDEYDMSDTQYPVFVKPARQGSSIGVTKVKRKKQFQLAIDEAFRSDDKILIEKNVNGREIECAVMGDFISGIGEIMASHEFYDYEAKYFDGGKSLVEVPADLDEETVEKIRSIVAKIVKIVGIKHMSRVDFFLTEEGDVYLNEINTMPGFTPISMYPVLLEEKGYSRSEIIDILIDKASR